MNPTVDSQPTKEDLEEKKRQRSLRFGIPVVETKPVKTSAKKQVTPTTTKAPQPVTPDVQQNSKVKPKVEIDPELAAKRKQKFGQSSPVKESKAKESKTPDLKPKVVKVTKKSLAVHVDPEIAKKRSERFGGSS